jgi:hypothetical protein
MYVDSYENDPARLYGSAQVNSYGINNKNINSKYTVPVPSFKVSH